MAEKLIPKLNKIKVAPSKLILDPNNPRLTSREQDKVPEANFGDPGVIAQTESRMHPGTFGRSGKKKKNDKDDKFDIRRLIESIQVNGWQPVDSIFVKKYDADKYLVIEGNRRVTAIRAILADDSDESIRVKSDLREIEVLEIIPEGSSEELDKKINYLLGVRHHGSLKKWSPFAQAHSLFKRYLELAKQDKASFQWDPKIGHQVAETVSVEDVVVHDRLKVYRVMEQLGLLPAVKEIDGMKGRYYSLCAEALERKELQGYIHQDPSTFLLGEDDLTRFDDLCHFSTENRNDAPITNPQEWRFLAKILAEEDKIKRTEMLSKVERDKYKPSVVWAERAEELSKPQWSTWLKNLNNVLAKVTFSDDLDSDAAKSTVRELVLLLEELDKR